MLFKYYYWAFIILWIPPGNLLSTCDQVHLRLAMNYNGDTVYLSNDTLKLNWYEAFCCCRSKGKTLVSTDSHSRLGKLKEDIYDYSNFGWLDGIVTSDGIWKHAVTGKVLPSKLFAHTEEAIPSEGFCTIFDYHSASLNSINCEEKRSQYLLCAEMKPDGDCYPTGLNPNPLEQCNKKTVIEYTKENVCPRRVLTTPASTMPPTSSITPTKPQTSSITPTMPPTSSITTTMPPASSITTTMPPASSIAPTMPPTSSITTSMSPTSSITPLTITTRSPKVCYECSAIRCSSN